jgi:hypothetical protein
MTTKCLPKRQDLKKINRKYHFSRRQRRKIIGQKMKRTLKTEKDIYRDHPSFWRWWAIRPVWGPPRPENDFQQFKQFWAILEAINSCHSIVWKLGIYLFFIFSISYWNNSPYVDQSPGSVFPFANIMCFAEKQRWLPLL